MGDGKIRDGGIRAASSADAAKALAGDAGAGLRGWRGDGDGMECP